MENPKQRTSDETSVLATIEAFSNAIKSNSPGVLRSLVVPSCTTTRTGQFLGTESPVHMTLEELVGYISAAAAAAPIEGTFNPDEAIVKSDGSVAMVWAPWKSYKSGELSHVGTMVFVLAKKDGKWIIVSSADSLEAV